MQTVSGSTKLGDRMDTEISYAEVVKRQGVPFNKKSYNNINKSFEQDDRDGGLNKHSFQRDQEDRKQQSFQDIKLESENKNHTFLLQEKDGQNKKRKDDFLLNIRARATTWIRGGRFCALPIKGVEQKITLQNMFGKKVQLAPALQERGLKLCRLFEKDVLGDKQVWAIIQNTNHFHLKVHRGQRVAALDQRSAPGRR